MSAFYIMKAHHMTSSGRKLGLKKILREEPDCTIVVATRHYGYDKKVPLFIAGSPSFDDYGVKSGDKTTYTIDTGNGYRCEGERLDIEHVIQVVDGKVTKVNGKLWNENKLPELPARYTFVMK
jgi:hypothetical protein